MTKRWRSALVVSFVYLLLAIWIDSPFLFLNKSLFLSDATYNVEPAARFARECWLALKHVPVWNPYVASGVPLAQVQWPLFYWPNWMFVFLPFPLATGTFLLLHQLVAGVGGFLWQYRADEVERSELKWLPAFIFGLAYMLSGYMAGSTINLQLFACAAWIPLALLLIDALIETAPAAQRLPVIGLLGFAVGTQATAGRPELLLCCILLYAAYLIERGRSSPKRSARAWGFVLYAFFAALVLAFIVSAVDLLPMLRIAASSPPSGSFASLGMTWWSAGWFDFAGVVLSQPVGEIKLPFYHLYPTYPGDSPYVTSLFVGAPVVTLAAIGLAHHRWRQRWFWLCWGLLFAALSAGNLGIIADLMRGIAPDLLVFRYPVKLAIFFLLAVCCAAAEGARAYLFDVGKGKTLLFVGLCWFLIAAAGLIFLLGPGQLPPAMPWSASDLAGLLAGGLSRRQWLCGELVVAGLTGIVSCLLFLPAVKRALDRRVGVAIWIGLVCATLAVNCTNHLWRTVDGKFFEVKSPLAQWIKTRTDMDLSSFHVLNLFDDPIIAPPAVLELPPLNIERAFMQYTRLLLRPNTNIDSEVRLSNGACTVPCWSDYFLYTGVLPRSSLQPGVAHPAGKSDLPLYRFCQATGTRFVLTPIGTKEPAPAAIKESGHASSTANIAAAPLLDDRFFKLVKSEQVLNLRVYEVYKVRPRFSLQHYVRLATSRMDALLAINRCDTSKYDPEKMVIITAPQDAVGSLPFLGLTKEPAVNSDTDSEANAGSIRLDSDAYDRLTVTVDALKETFLIVTDSWDPGWEAYDNGAATPIYLADGLIQAVHLNPGNHKLFFVYRPLALTWGAIASKMGLLLICALLLGGAVTRLFRGKKA